MIITVGRYVTFLRVKNYFLFRKSNAFLFTTA